MQTCIGSQKIRVSHFVMTDFDEPFSTRKVHRALNGVVRIDGTSHAEPMPVRNELKVPTVPDCRALKE